MDYLIIQDGRGVTAEEAIALWTAVNWGKAEEYETTAVARALADTDFMVAVREGQRLIGLARVFSDGAIHTNIAEIVVHPDYQQQGIGTEMMRIITGNFKHTNIFTEALDGQANRFYESFGYGKRQQMAVFSRKADK